MHKPILISTTHLLALKFPSVLCLEMSRAVLCQVATTITSSIFSKFSSMYLSAIYNEYDRKSQCYISYQFLNLTNILFLQSILTNILRILLIQVYIYTYIVRIVPMNHINPSCCVTKLF